MGCYGTTIFKWAPISLALASKDSWTAEARPLQCRLTGMGMSSLSISPLKKSSNFGDRASGEDSDPLRLLAQAKVCIWSPSSDEGFQYPTGSDQWMLARPWTGESNILSTLWPEKRTILEGWEPKVRGSSREKKGKDREEKKKREREMKRQWARRDQTVERLPFTPSAMTRIDCRAMIFQTAAYDLLPVSSTQRQPPRRQASCFITLNPRPALYLAHGMCSIQTCRVKEERDLQLWTEGAEHWVKHDQRHHGGLFN